MRLRRQARAARPSIRAALALHARAHYGALAPQASSRREALELLSGAAGAWEEAGKLSQAMLVRLSHKELRSAGLEMLHRTHPERDRLRQVELPRDAL